MREMKKNYGPTEKKPVGREEFGEERNEKTPRRTADPAAPGYLMCDIDPAIPGYDTWDFERNREGQGRSRRTP
jgi:hypothetical protein